MKRFMVCFAAASVSAYLIWRLAFSIFMTACLAPSLHDDVIEPDLPPRFRVEKPEPWFEGPSAELVLIFARPLFETVGAPMFLGARLIGRYDLVDTVGDVRRAAVFNAAAWGITLAFCCTIVARLRSRRRADSLSAPDAP